MADFCLDEPFPRVQRCMFEPGWKLPNSILFLCLWGCCSTRDKLHWFHALGWWCAAWAHIMPSQPIIGHCVLQKCKPALSFIANPPVWDHLWYTLFKFVRKVTIVTVKNKGTWLPGLYWRQFVVLYINKGTKCAYCSRNKMCLRTSWVDRPTVGQS